MELSAADLRRRLSEAGLEITSADAERLRGAANGTLGTVARLRAVRLGNVEPAPVLDAGFGFAVPATAGEEGRDGGA